MPLSVVVFYSESSKVSAERKNKNSTSSTENSIDTITTCIPSSNFSGDNTKLQSVNSNGFSQYKDRPLNTIKQEHLSKTTTFHIDLHQCVTPRD
jgi:hypothetical protein